MTASRSDVGSPAAGGRRWSTWQWLLVLASAAVTAALIYLILREVEAADVVRFVGALSAGELSLYATLYLALGVLRAERFRRLLEPPVPLRALVSVTFVHNLLTQLLPARSGELSYPLLLRFFHARSAATAFGGLIMARLLDLVMVMMFGILATLFALHAADAEARFLALAAAGAVAAVAALRYAPAIGRFGVDLANQLLATLGASLRHPAIRVMLALDRVITHIERYSRRERLLPLLLLSTLIYLGNVASLCALLVSLQPGLALPESVAIVSFVMIASWIPLSIAGFGIIEGSWAIALVIIGGLSLSEAAALALVLHLGQLLSALVTGAGGGLALALARIRGASRAGAG